MPNSGTVTAGSVALASQYNNLRADVLDASTGHVHDGSADGGKQIEGTVLKSTGATAGQVLTASAGTGATWASPSVGALNTVTGTATWAAFSTASSTFYNAGNNLSKFAVTGDGTVIVSVTTTANTSARTLYYWNLSSAGGTAVRAGTASPALTTAGTVSQVNISGKGFSGGGVVFFEGVNATTSGSVTGTLRRYTSTLGTNSWNTSIYASPGVAATNFNAWEQVAFSTFRPFWFEDANMWMSWDTRTAATTLSYVYAVNDTSGTLYSSAWATAVSSSDRPTLGRHLAYVPGLAGADGTVHFFAYRQTADNPRTFNYLRIAYTLGTAALTASSTATSTTGWAGLASNGENNESAPQEDIFGGYWDPALSNYVLFTSTDDNFYAVGFERTMGTALWRSRIQNTQSMALPVQTSTSWDPSTRIYTANGSNAYAYQAGSAGNFYVGMRPLFGVSNGATSSDDAVMGAGSATHAIQRATGGTAVRTIAIANTYTSFTIAANTAARLISFDTNPSGDARPISSISAANAYPLNYAFGDLTNDTTLTNAMISKGFPIILPANESMTVYTSNIVAQTGGASMSLFNLDGAYAATAVYTFRTISLG
jgi:hypothetical protein